VPLRHGSIPVAEATPIPSPQQWASCSRRGWLGKMVACVSPGAKQWPVPSRGDRNVVEIGPGNVLSGLVKRELGGGQRRIRFAARGSGPLSNLPLVRRSRPAQAGPADTRGPAVTYAAGSASLLVFSDLPAAPSAAIRQTNRRCRCRDRCGGRQPRSHPFDPPLLGQCPSGRPVAFMAKAELFQGAAFLARHPGLVGPTRCQRVPRPESDFASPMARLAEGWATRRVFSMAPAKLTVRVNRSPAGGRVPCRRAGANPCCLSRSSNKPPGPGQGLALATARTDPQSASVSRLRPPAHAPARERLRPPPLACTTVSTAYWTRGCCAARRRARFCRPLAQVAAPDHPDQRPAAIPPDFCGGSSVHSRLRRVTAPG